MRVAVIGSGSLGLVVASCLAEFGNEVTCAWEERVDLGALGTKAFATTEPALAELVASNGAAGRLRFVGTIAEAAKDAEVVILIIGVGLDGDGKADLSRTFAVVDTLASCLSPGAVVVLKSTVPVGTADRVQVRLNAKSDANAVVVSNPTFVKQGDRVADFLKPSRIVLGSEDPVATATLKRLFAPFVRTQDRILVVDRRSAELSKYASSGLLATRISFMNEMALLAEELGADIESVRTVMGADPRIGPRSLFVGPGYGGEHFSNDISMLLHTAREAGHGASVVEAADQVNTQQRAVMLRKIRRALGEDLEGRAVAVWGLAFKPATSDVRQAPAICLVEDLLSAGATVCVHDPKASENAAAILGDRVTYAPKMYAAATGAEVLVLMTEWPQYRRPDFARIRSEMKGHVIVDGRNIWDPQEVRDHGFVYWGVGRR